MATDARRRSVREMRQYVAHARADVQKIEAQFGSDAVVQAVQEEDGMMEVFELVLLYIEKLRRVKERMIADLKRR